jgi:hypothetical protein
MDTNLDQLVQVNRQLHAEMQLQASNLQLAQQIDQYGRRRDQNANQMADRFRTEIQRLEQGHRLRQQINHKIADARQVNTENYSFNMLKRVVKIDKNVHQLPQNICHFRQQDKGITIWRIRYLRSSAKILRTGWILTDLRYTGGLRIIDKLANDE